MQRLEGPAHLDGQGFSGVLVLQSQELQRRPAHGPGEDEVVGPHMIGMLGDSRHALAGPHLLPPGPPRELQPQLLPEAADRLVVHDDVRPSQERPDPDLAVPRVLHAQGPHLLSQVILRFGTDPVAHPGPRNADQGGDPPL